MIRDTAAYDLGATALSFRVPYAPQEASAVTVSASAQTGEPNPPAMEQEIARLTWAVLDGGASLGDRQRLAELVNAQHALRRRFDR